MTESPYLRRAGLAALVLLAVVLQTSVLSQVSVRGVVPDLALVLVAAVGMVRGPQSGAVTGFCAGLLVDLAPPADHSAGIWALVLLGVGMVAGGLRPTLGSAPGSTRLDPVRPVLAVGALSLAAHAMVTVLLLATGSPLAGPGPTAQVVVLAMLLDVIVAAILLAPLLRLLTRLLHDVPGGRPPQDVEPVTEAVPAATPTATPEAAPR